MKHCLNKRDHHETSFDEQEDLPKKLQTGYKGQFQELTDSTDAWWRSPVGPETKFVKVSIPEEVYLRYLGLLNKEANK